MSIFKPIKSQELEPGVEYLLFNEKWIDEDVSGKGFRLGSVSEDGVWSTAEYSSYKDCYFHRTSEEDDASFQSSKASDQVPTHFMNLPDQTVSFTHTALPK